MASVRWIFFAGLLAAHPAAAHHVVAAPLAAYPVATYLAAVHPVVGSLAFGFLLWVPSVSLFLSRFYSCCVGLTFPHLADVPSLHI